MLPSKKQLRLRTPQRGGPVGLLVPLLAALALLAGCEAGPPAFGGAEAQDVGAEAESRSSVAADRARGDGPAPDVRQPRNAAAAQEPGEATGSSPAGEVSSSPDSAEAGGGVAGTSQTASTGPTASSSPREVPGPRRPRDEWGTERFPHPGSVRGLYLNAWASGSSTRIESLIELARRTEINSFVIDIKDATGYVSHRTEVPLAREIGATGELRIRDLPGLLSRLEQEGIYPIARIVIVKDPLLIAARPELAIQDTAGGVWVDSKDIVWLNPFNREVWDYHVDLAREVAEMGFPEIQWDYVRFPDAPRSDIERAVFSGAEGRTRAEGIRGFLNYARAELAEVGVLSTADVFGVTTSAARDVGIGQVWEEFIDVVDAALPMVYPSHYWRGSFGYQTPNAYPYEIVHRALRDAMGRSDRVPGAGLTRPYLQDFTLGPPRYEAPEVRAQIQATYDAGIDEWILWNPGSRYTEEALEPVGGFQSDPMMRVAGAIHPVSRRQAVIDSVRAARQAAEARAEALRDSLDALPDSAPTEPGATPPSAEPTPADTAQAGGSAREQADTLRISGP